MADVVRLAILQFSFSNGAVVPPSAKRRLKRETPKDRAERKSHSNGVVILQPTEGCSVGNFLGELQKAGYQLVDLAYEERIHLNNHRKTYHMVRYIFAHPQFVETSPEFEKERNIISAELNEMCRVAMWRVRAFNNPFFENGNEVPGQQALSINLESRQPLFLPDGKPVVEWERDGAGNKVGEGPIPIKPKLQLNLNLR